MYSNDVDYVFRQENDLYYLTNLKQKGATLVIKKSGGKVTETLYLPKRVPSQEAWTGKMYSKEEAAAIFRASRIWLMSDGLNAYLQTIKDRTDTGIQTIYLLTRIPENEEDPTGMREFGAENELLKQLTGYKVVNPYPIFADLRQIKSPYEIKMLQHAIDITTEAHIHAPGQWQGGQKWNMKCRPRSNIRSAEEMRTSGDILR